jgi:glycerophosphoryl diester phosphodiesterase
MPTGVQAWPYPLWIAHRGAGKLAPENTLAAFRLGASLGYRAFECDVKLSADGVPFLLHDDTLQRTSNGQGVAGEVRWAELSRLDAGSWHSRAFAGEPLPSLDNIARFAQHNGHTLNLEIKPTTGQELLTGQVVGTACLRWWSNAALPPLFSSFKPDALRGLRETAPAMPRALLLDTLWSGWFEVAQQLDCVAVVSQHRLMDAALMAQLKTAGLRALCYTVNEVADAKRLITLGIDGLVTDAVDRFAPGRGAVQD